MKTKSILILILCTTPVFTMCKNKKQTLDDSEQKQEQARLEELYSTEETLDTILPDPGIKYREMRKVDPQNPPVAIDIEHPADVGEFDLNRFYPQVEYVKIEHPLSREGIAFLGNSYYEMIYERGMTSGRGLNSNVYLTENKLIAGDFFFGYHCFDLQGNYLYTIAAKKELPEFDVKANKVSLDWSLVSETINAFSVLDDNCLILKIAGRKGTFHFHNVNSQKNYLSRPASYGSPILLSPDTYVGFGYNASAKEQLPILCSFTIRGDTLARFMNYNPLADTGKGAYTNPESSNFYRYGKHLTMRQAYNDTIFRVSADRLTPAFVLNTGSKKPDVQTALKGDKKGKIFIVRLFETDDFLFIIHSEDYDCPNNRKSGAVKFFYSYYDKKAGKRYSIPGSDYPERFVLKNSTPDAIPLMATTATVYNDKLCAQYTKTQLKQIIDSDAFASFPSWQQEKLKSFHDELTDYELLIMILKRKE